MSSLRFLRTFVAIEEHGSMAAAAAHVALTQAAVGQQMRALEDEFRRPLFDRSGRVVRLSPEGRALLPHVRRILAIYEEMLGVGLDTSKVSGTITVGAIVSAMGFLSDNVLELKRRYPGLDVRLVHAHASVLAAQVGVGEIDAAIVVEREEAHKGMSWSPLYEEPLILLASRRAASRQTDVRSLLQSQPFIRFDRTSDTGAKIERTLRRLHVKPNEVLEVNTIGTIMDLVRQNVGISLVPKLKHVAWSRETSVTPLPLPGGAPGRHIGLLENMLQPAKTSVLREQLIRALSA